jgi:AmmeMemoRadiSam system protein B
VDFKASACKIAFCALIIFTACGSRTAGEYHYSVKSDDPESYEEFISAPVNLHTSLRHVRAGIVSHHLFAGAYIAGFFNSLRDSVNESVPVRTIIVLAPDHFARTSAPVAVSARDWKTPFGVINPDHEKIKILVDHGVAKIDEDVFCLEHSVSAVVPFISKYFPSAEIVPLLMGHSMTYAAAAVLGDALAGLCGENDFVLLSADFVHDKPSREAMRFDTAARAVLTDPPRWTINAIDDIKVDCRRGLAAMLIYLRHDRGITCDILANTNSAIIAGKDVEATSYFFAIFGY